MVVIAIDEVEKERLAGAPGCGHPAQEQAVVYDNAHVAGEHEVGERCQVEEAALDEAAQGVGVLAWDEAVIVVGGMSVLLGTGALGGRCAFEPGFYPLHKLFG